MEPAKLKKLARKPLLNHYFAAREDEREGLRAAIDAEAQQRIAKMERKGYQLVARIDDVYGLFAMEHMLDRIEWCTGKAPQNAATV